MKGWKLSGDDTSWRLDVLDARLLFGAKKYFSELSASFAITSVARFESQDVGEGDAEQMRADFPDRQGPLVDEFVDCRASQLPSARELRHGEPRWFTGASARQWF
jgi:hypothetical protein